MMAGDSLNKEFVDVIDTLENETEELENSDNSSDSESEISLSEKIVMESNGKRLRQKMTSLQNSIINLKEQLKQEKQLWKEDMEKIRILQQQQEIKCCCMYATKSKESSKCDTISKSSSLCTVDSDSKKFDDILKTHSIKQLLDLQNYKRKLAETENMCNLELSRVKQSLEDLKTLQSIASEWGRDEAKIETEENLNKDGLKEIFIKSENKIE